MHLFSIVLFGLLYAALWFAWQVPFQLGLLYLLASVIAFACYGWDKAAARAGRRRTPEATLLLLGLACGWPGAALAQRLFRHKTAKRAFQLPFWTCVLANVAAFAWLVSPWSPLG